MWWRNKKYRFFKTSVCFSNLEEWQENILFDPQTSGGLLFSIPENETYKIKQEFLEKNLSLYEIGKVSKRRKLNYSKVKYRF